MPFDNQGYGSRSLCFLLIMLFLLDIFAISICASLDILKRKSFATLKNAIFFQNFLSVILRLTSPVLCLAYNMKIRRLWLMVAEKTTKLQCYPFYKSNRGAIPYILCENEVSINRLFSKQKG